MIAEQLRRAVLQAAISGQLTEQRPEDGTAAELLEHIATERDLLVKAGKLKKQNPLPSVTDDDKFFEIPNSWCWVYLLEIAHQVNPSGVTVKTGKLPSTGKYPVVSQGMRTVDGYIDDRTGLQFVEDVPVVIFGDHNRIVKIVDFPFVVGADGVKILGPLGISFKYLYYVISYSSLLLPDRGYGRHFGLLKRVPLSLPPLTEQERIVAKLDRIMPVIDKLEKLEREREDLDRTFAKAIEASILQAAISGQLTEQRPEDGTAAELLEEIAAERERLVKADKLKKQKALPYIRKNEMVLSIPQSWQWARLGSVGEVVGGGTPKTSVLAYWGSEIPWVTPTDLGTLSSLYVASGRRSISREGLERSSARLLPKNSLIVSSRAPIGYVAISANPLATNQGCKSLVPFLSETVVWLYWVVRTLKNDIEKLGTGTTFKEISGVTLGSVVVPLPPLAEQERIVGKLEQLSEPINQLKTALFG